MHEDETCTQFFTEREARVDEEASSLAEVGKISKACPNVRCGARLDKYDGCDHVTCKFPKRPWGSVAILTTFL
jgi:hypothetical protein